MFTSDQPIKSSKEDVLGRVSFAQHLGEAIINYKETDSLVIGLFGSWGSGKTSILNMCLEYVDIESVKYADEEKPIIVKFNPWNFSDQNQLISQFFIQLSCVLGQVDYAKELKVIGEKLEKYASIFEPLSWVPTVGQYVDKISKTLKSTGSAAKNWGELKERDLNSTKEELNKLLDKQSHKILIVIDDIDRLNDLEIRQIFQLVKSLGDFSNTIYLLAFDRDVVINALRKVQEGSGVEYLEKVVQIPFNIPMASSQVVEDILLTQLSELIKDIPDNELNTTYFGNIYHSGFKYFFKNIRDVKRYINSLQFNYEIVKEEVNVIDFIAITGIQVFFPEVYSEIRDNSEIFTGIYVNYEKTDIVKEQYKKRCDQIINNVKKIQPEIFLNFLKRLFPKLETFYSNIYYSNEDLHNWRRDCRICSPDFFERYFKLSISSGEISQKDIKAILSLSNDPALFSKSIIDLVKDGRILTFLNLLGDYTRDAIPEENIEPIITVLMDLGDSFTDRGKSIFDKTQYKLSRLFDQLIQRITDQEKRYSIYNNSIYKATNSLYTIVYEVNKLGKEHGRFGPVENLKPEEERTINFQQLNALEELACEKIKNWANDGRLVKHKNLRHILNNWKIWGTRKQVSDFVENQIKHDDSLIYFLTGFLEESYTQVLGDYAPKRELDININSINEFIELREIEPRIRKIYSSSDFKQLEETQKTAIEKILEEMDRKSEESF
jgi:predicted KAP-like P-loop ATPase